MSLFSFSVLASIEWLRFVLEFHASREVVRVVEDMTKDQ